MKSFMGKNFLLSTEKAKELFHDYAEEMPIIDYHCHIDPKAIWEDRKFNTITEAWLGGDHYKWRIMRACGIDEKYITGDADDFSKFRKYAEALELSVGNPLYHWSHLELQRFFGYEGVLNSRNAEEVYEFCNEKLKDDLMSVRNLIIKSNVDVVCTTDDPVDSLIYHKKLREDPLVDFKVLPAWRPDKAMNIDKPGFAAYMEKLSEVSGIRIKDFASLVSALKKRMQFFDGMGCKVSDHGIDFVAFNRMDEAALDRVLTCVLNGGTVTPEEALGFKTEILLELCREYARLGWVLQLHYGCQRGVNTRMTEKLGPDTGYDAINNYAPGSDLAAFLNELDKDELLPKTIVYSLNPGDNELIDTVIGCFQGGGIAGKMQHGTAWWFNDHKFGMQKQLTDLASTGVLGNFVGMLTDSRSFLSYTRHEYFRRILCDLIGGWVENGEYPDDPVTLQKIIENICYDNARRYFNF